MVFSLLEGAFHSRTLDQDREKSSATYFKLPNAGDPVPCSLLPPRSGEKSWPKVSSRVISDAIIGLSDGLTVPFALTAGLSALGETKVVVYGGLAELIAGAISMGLGGYLAAQSEEASYRATMIETQDKVYSDPVSVSSSISAIFEPYDLPDAMVDSLTSHLSRSSKLPEFLMQFQHTLEEPAESRAMTCAITIALGYFIGGFIPLLPYFFVKGHQVITALYFSVIIMLIALFVFGYVKTCFVLGWRGSTSIRKGVLGGIQMIVVGSMAAGSAMAIVRIFQRLSTSNIS